jgi:site-specific recombinase XerD
MAGDRIELAKVSGRHLDLITPTELARLLDAPKGNDVKELRDKAILELLFSTGLRVSEMCSLPRDININSEELSVRGKGGKVRVVFISERARDAVKKYLEARKDMAEGLFVRLEPDKSQKEKKKPEKKYTGKDYGNLDRHSVEAIVKRYAIIAGIGKKVTPHTLRHLFATDLLSNGADLRSVQALLGHSSIVTTQIYTHVTDKHLHDIHKKFHNKG